MKFIYAVLTVSFFCALTGCSQQRSETTVELKNELDSVSYCLGKYIAQSEKSQGMTEINAQALAAAFNDVFKGNAGLVDDSMTEQVLNHYFEHLQASKYDGNIKAGKDFLTENKSKDGVVELPDGLQYKILKAGTGEKPGPTSKVTVHYTGSTIDGKVFDSSEQRGEPATFTVNQVILGWQEALQLMPAGSKWRLFIPSELAYGSRGSSPVIEPYSTLIFDVELISIEN